MDLRELQSEYLRQERTVTVEKLKAGSLVRTILSQEDGLYLTDGRTEKPKLLVIVGVDVKSSVLYGSVLVNTNMNPKAQYSEEYLSAQYLLQKENYPDFLRYDSFVDCGQIIPIPFAKLERGEYFGALNNDDSQRIFDILETTDTLSTKEKKKYGIRRR